LEIYMMILKANEAFKKYGHNKIVGNSGGCGKL
jgi:hypothetical protein